MEKQQTLDSLFRLMRVMRRSQPTRHGPEPPHHGASEGPPHHGAHHAHGYGRLLEAIARQEGVSARELTEILDLRPSSLSEMLSKLEARGDIRRQRDEKDGRISRIWLTRQGSQRLRQHDENWAAYQKKLLDCLTEEEALQLNKICQKLIFFLEQDQPKEKEESVCRQEDPAECGGRTDS